MRKEPVSSQKLVFSVNASTACLTDHPAGCLRRWNIFARREFRGGKIWCCLFFSLGKRRNQFCLPFAWIQAIKLLISWWWWWCIFRSVRKEMTRCSFYSTLPCCQDPQFWDLGWCLSSCSMRHYISEAIVFLPPSDQKVEQRNLQDSTAMQGAAQHWLLNLLRMKLLERTEAHL